MHPSPSNHELLQARMLRDQGITALRKGDTAAGRELLVQALELDPTNEYAWLWISMAMAKKAERAYCLGRVLAINPQNEAASRGLSKLAGVLPSAPAFVAASTVMSGLRAPQTEQPAEPAEPALQAEPAAPARPAAEQPTLLDDLLGPAGPTPPGSAQPERRLSLLDRLDRPSRPADTTARPDGPPDLQPQPPEDPTPPPPELTSALAARPAAQAPQPLDDLAALPPPELTPALPQPPQGADITGELSTLLDQLLRPAAERETQAQAQREQAPPPSPRATASDEQAHQEQPAWPLPQLPPRMQPLSPELPPLNHALQAPSTAGLTTDVAPSATWPPEDPAADEPDLLQALLSEATPTLPQTPPEAAARPATPAVSEPAIPQARRALPRSAGLAERAPATFSATREAPTRDPLEQRHMARADTLVETRQSAPALHRSGRRVIWSAVTVVLLILGLAPALAGFGADAWLRPLLCRAQSYHEQLTPLLREWEEADALAQRAPRFALSTQVDQLQTLRWRVADVPAPGCAAGPRRHLLRAMNQDIGRYLDFMARRPQQPLGESCDDTTRCLASIRSYFDFLAESPALAQPPLTDPTPGQLDAAEEELLILRRRSALLYRD